MCFSAVPVMFNFIQCVYIIPLKTILACAIFFQYFSYNHASAFTFIYSVLLTSDIVGNLLSEFY